MSWKLSWFRQIWPTRYHNVLADYAAVGGLKHFLTDIALRGGVFTPHGPTNNLYEAGRREGERTLALHIIRIAGEDPAALSRFIEKAPGASK